MTKAGGKLVVSSFHSVLEIAFFELVVIDFYIY